MRIGIIANLGSQRLRLLAASRQRWELSGASMVPSRIRTPRISMVSPAMTVAVPWIAVAFATSGEYLAMPFHRKRLHHLCSGQSSRLSSSQYRLHEFRRQQGHPQQPTDIGWIDVLGVSDFLDGLIFRGVQGPYWTSRCITCIRTCYQSLSRRRRRLCR